MECYSPFCFLHQFFIPHSPHFGLRAVHTYRPCKINQWCALDNHSAGILATSCFSVSSGVRAPVTNPIRSATRNTCVSTGIAGRPKATASITFAVFRPTPGKVCSKSTVSTRKSLLSWRPPSPRLSGIARIMPESPYLPACQYTVPTG